VDPDEVIVAQGGGKRAGLAVIAKGVHKAALQRAVAKRVVSGQERRQRYPRELASGDDRRYPNDGAVTDLIELAVLDIDPVTSRNWRWAFIELRGYSCLP
jgi:hypothetical protein